MADLGAPAVLRRLGVSLGLPSCYPPPCYWMPLCALLCPVCAEKEPGTLLPGCLPLCTLSVSLHALLYGLPSVGVDGLPGNLCGGLYGVSLLWRDPYIYSSLFAAVSLVCGRLCLRVSSIHCITSTAIVSDRRTICKHIILHKKASIYLCNIPSCNLC